MLDVKADQTVPDLKLSPRRESNGVVVDHKRGKPVIGAACRRRADRPGLSGASPFRPSYRRPRGVSSGPESTPSDSFSLSGPHRRRDDERRRGH